MKKGLFFLDCLALEIEGTTLLWNAENYSCSHTELCHGRRASSYWEAPVSVYTGHCFSRNKLACLWLYFHVPYMPSWHCVWHGETLWKCNGYLAWLMADSVWHNYENNQRDALYRLIYYSKSALHVSGDVFAHRQEHMTVFTVSGSVRPRCCRLPAGSNLGEHYQIL